MSLQFSLGTVTQNSGRSACNWKFYLISYPALVGVEILLPQWHSVFPERSCVSAGFFCQWSGLDQHEIRRPVSERSKLQA